MAGLRVLIVGINFAPEPTGVAPYTTGLADGLAARGFKVEVVTAFPHYPEWRVAQGWSGLTTNESRGPVSVRRVRHYVPRDPTGVRRALSEVSFGVRSVTQRWAHPDLVICPSPALFASAVALCRVEAGRRRPGFGMIVQDLYGAGSQQAGGYGALATRLLERFEGSTLRRADGVIAIHERLRRRLVDDFRVATEKVTVIRNWTHVQSASRRPIAETRARFGWGSDEFVVLHTGAMGEKQNLGTVVAAARLAEARGARVRFVLMGDGGRRADLEAAGAGVKTLHVVPPVSGSDYPDVLAAADLLLVNERPGMSDMALPSKLTSYFKSGVAVLAATEAHSATAEEVRASGAGVVVPPGDPNLVLEATADLASDTASRRNLGLNGPRYCEMILSQDAALDAYASWATRLVDLRRRAS